MSDQGERKGVIVAGLWSKQSKAGRKYLTGKLREGFHFGAGTTLALFKNDRKEQDNHPDYNLVAYEMAEDRGRREERQPEPANAGAEEELPF